MKNKGFEVKVTRKDGSTYDRPVNTRADGDGWAKNYVDGTLGERAQSATFFVDGKPQVTYHNPE